MIDPIEPILTPPIDEQRIAEGWSRIQLARSDRRRSRVPAWTFAFGAIAVAAIALYVLWPHRSPGSLGPLTSNTPHVDIVAGAVIEAPTTRQIAFADGSALDLDGGARLQVLENESDRFVVLLRGHVRFDVMPNGPRRWKIETSKATIEVIGTQFVVDASEQRVTIEVLRGVVMVRGERVQGRAVRLVAGDHLTIEDPEKTAEVVPPPQPPTPAPAPVITAAPPPTPPPPIPVAPPTPAKPLVHSPILTPAPPAANPLTEADQRRAAGDPKAAAALLERTIRDAHDPEIKGLAAFSLGRIYLEDLGDPDRAAAAFEQVIALHTPQALLEDAYARRITALVKAKHHPEAVSALHDYVKNFPHGVRTTQLEALVGP